MNYELRKSLITLCLLALTSTLACAHWLEGKRVAWYGTSIPAGFPYHNDGQAQWSYANRAVAELGGTIVNRSVSGSTIVYKPGVKHFCELPFTNDEWDRGYLAGMADLDEQIDLYVFDFGANDGQFDQAYFQGLDLRRLDWNNTDRSTFFGAYNLVIRTLLSRKPDARIALVTHYADDADEPWNFPHAKGGYRKMNDLIVQIASHYQLPVCDLRSRTGWNIDNLRSTWCKDGIHPAADHNEASIQLLQRLVSDFLRTLPYASGGNPVFDGWYADPEAVIFDGQCWIYPTGNTPQFDCFSSPDLQHWQKHPGVLRLDSISWGRKCLWAPAIVKRKGKYYLFFSANDVHPGEVGGIGVAVADRPEGPFRDLLGHPLIQDNVNGAQPIDQFVFRQGKEYYMYYGGWGHCNVVRLRKDFTGIRPFPDGTLYKEVTPENYVEGPFMFKRKGKYYFMWSEGGWTGPDYSVAYAISDSPFGPFKRQQKILQQDPAIGTGAGHHSVINVPGTDDYYIVYHRHPLCDNLGGHRYVCIDKMEFNADGTIRPVRITMEGVGCVKL